MRISGFHVDGFGALSDFGIDDLSPGLVILHGPNEAGKSTMLDFLTGMLFGFPSRRDNPRFRAPVRGGRHGGSLTLAEENDSGAESDKLWWIERYVTSRRELAIRRPDGSPASEDELKRTLGGADETLFRAVFAVDLTDLANAEAMTRDEVSELLFSASIVGQRRSAARAMASLQKQRLELARTRQADARANSLLRELEEVRRSLAEASHEAAAYPARQRELGGLDSEVTEAREHADRIDHRRRELDLLIRLWDVLERRREADQRLAAWDDPGPIAGFLEEHSAELESLRSTCSGHLERVSQLAELKNQRAGIEQSIEAALASLGGGWDRERVRKSGGWIGLSDEARHFRDSSSDSESHWRAVKAISDEADNSPDLASWPDQQVAESTEAPKAELDARLVGELRKNLAEQRRLVAEQEAAKRRSAGGSGTLTAAAGIWVALVGTVVASLGAVAALVSSTTAVRALCAVLGLAGFVLVAVAVVARRRGILDSSPQRTDLSQACVHVAERVAELAISLGLSRTPSDSDLETVAENIEVARSRERTLEDERRRILGAIERQRAAHEALDRACEELRDQQARFTGWKAAQGLATTLSPEGALESLAALQAVSSYLGALDRVDNKIEQLSAATATFEARLASVSSGFRDTGGCLQARETDPARALEELNASLEDVLERKAARSSLLRVLEETDAELDRSLGFGAEARRLRAELDSGEVLAWNEELETLAQARLDARESLEQLVRTHQDASNDLRALAGSGQIAELEQRRLTLEHDLNEVLRSFALLGCARLLLERTLRRHEQERQPAVLARAAERFAKVTEGRYMSLLPSIGDEGGRQAIRVVSCSGAELDAASLSRGSVEQLYLCLRIGLAETFAERAESLPLILDDVLVNFDPARAACIAEVLAETSERHQVLFFTCHPHLTDLMLRAAPQAQVVHLERV